MSETGLGFWVDVLRGETELEAGGLLLNRLLDDPGQHEALDKARRIVAAMTPAAVCDQVLPGNREIAEAVAAGRIPPEWWHSAAVVRLLVETAGSLREAERGSLPEVRAGRPLRERLRRRAGLRPRHRRGRWAAGTLAAALLLGALALAFTPPPWARPLGVNRIALWTMPDTLARDVRQTLEGREPSPPVFEERPPAQVAERSVAGAPVPEPITPRWETVRDPWPELHWDPGLPSAGGKAKVIVVDASHRLVWETETEQNEIEYPRQAPALQSGGTYYWKVGYSAFGGDRIGSAFVGFRVLDAGSADHCRRVAEHYAARPFILAVALERCGLYSEATRAYRRAANSLADPRPAERALEVLARRQGPERSP